MPTAGELKYHGFIDAFLKLDGIDRPGQQRRLNEAFLKIDDAVAALSNPTGSFIKLEHKYDQTFDVIGDSFLKVGADFQEIAAFGVKLDNLVTGGVKGNAAVVEGGGVQADFLKLDSALKLAGGDLKIFGADFLKWNDARTPDAFLKIEAVLGDGSVRVADGASATADAFRAIGADFLNLSNPDSTNPLDLAYKELGGDLLKLSSQYDTLAADFLKLSDAFHGSGDSGGGGIVLTAAVASSGLGAGLTAINNDFLKIDTGFADLGAPVSQFFAATLKWHGVG